jgi:hypothetical protein
VEGTDCDSEGSPCLIVKTARWLHPEPRFTIKRVTACAGPEQKGPSSYVYNTMSFATTSIGKHSEWHAILVGVSMLLKTMQSNISAVHISVKWDQKTKDTISLQATKVHSD